MTRQNLAISQWIQSARWWFCFVPSLRLPFGQAISVKNWASTSTVVFFWNVLRSRQKAKRFFAITTWGLKKLHSIKFQTRIVLKQISEKIIMQMAETFLSQRHLDWLWQFLFFVFGFTGKNTKDFPSAQEHLVFQKKIFIKALKFQTWNDFKKQTPEKINVQIRPCCTTQQTVLSFSTKFECWSLHACKTLQHESP